MELPQTITNPIPVVVNKQTREAFESPHGYMLIINRVDEHGEVHQDRHRSRNWNAEHEKKSYGLIAGDMLRFDVQQEVVDIVVAKVVDIVVAKVLAAMEAKNTPEPAAKLTFDSFDDVLRYVQANTPKVQA